MVFSMILGSSRWLMFVCLFIVIGVILSWILNKNCVRKFSMKMGIVIMISLVISIVELKILF